MAFSFRSRKSPQEKFWKAAKKGDLKTLKDLWSKGQVDLEAKLEGRSPLYIAARNNHVECIKYLHSIGGDLHARRENGCTPPYTAAQENNLKALDCLYDLGADLNIKSESGHDCMYTASFKGFEEMVLKLYNYGCDVNTRSVNHYSAAFVSVQNGKIKTLKLLYELGADLNFPNSYGGYPIIMACKNGNLEILEFLHQCGTPLRVTSEEKDLEADANYQVAMSQNHKHILNFFKTHKTLKEATILRTKSVQLDLIYSEFLTNILRLPIADSKGWIFIQDDKNLHVSKNEQKTLPEIRRWLIGIEEQWASWLPFCKNVKLQPLEEICN